MQVTPREYAGQRGPMTADGILRFAMNPRAYMRMKNQEARVKCWKQGICTSCRTAEAVRTKTKCAPCLENDRVKAQQRRARA